MVVFLRDITQGFTKHLSCHPQFQLRAQVWYCRSFCNTDFLFAHEPQFSKLTFLTVHKTEALRQERCISVLRGDTSLTENLSLFG